MGDGSIIGDIKHEVIKQIINDEAIVKAIDSQQVSDKEDIDELIGVNIFDYNQDPNTLDKADTIITVQAHINEGYDANDTFLEAELQIIIISHYKHMRVNNVPKIRENRNDYIARLIKRKFNDNRHLAIGHLKLVKDHEGAYVRDYLYREIKFTGLDLNANLCDDDE